MFVVQYGGAYEVTPSNSANLPQATVGLYVGGVGDVKVDDFQNHTATFKAVPVGTFIPGQFKKVHATGTSATFIVALTAPGPTVA